MEQRITLEGCSQVIERIDFNSGGIDRIIDTAKNAVRDGNETGPYNLKSISFFFRCGNSRVVAKLTINDQDKIAELIRMAMPFARIRVAWDNALEGCLRESQAEEGTSGYDDEIEGFMEQHPVPEFQQQEEVESAIRAMLNPQCVWWQTETCPIYEPREILNQ